MNVNYLSVTASEGSGSHYGEELITNGGFDTDTAWTKANGSTIDGDEAIFNTAVNYANLLYQPCTLVNGKTYKVDFTITSYTSGSIRFVIGTKDDGTTNGISYSANNTYSVEFTINDVSFTQQFTFISWDSGAVMHIDNVSVKEVL